jgi:4-hydroxy-tetrahydrodipicolinate synthase
MASERLIGIIAAAATPLRPNGTIDLEGLEQHCRRLLDHGCDGINLLGTTGEATSFSLEQREEAMLAISRSALPLDRFMVGTGAAALADTARLTAKARELGFAGALVLPPFYYKNISAEGLADFLEALIAKVGKKDLRIYLYHYPQLSGVPYPPDLVARFYQKYSEQMIGLKDSSGELAYSLEIARACRGFDVFPSSEAAFGDANAALFAGCISASVNINAPLVARSRKLAGATPGVAALKDATAIRAALTGVPLIPAIKWALAELFDDAAWRQLMPPLHPLSERDAASLRAALSPTRFAELKSAFR